MRFPPAVALVFSIGLIALAACTEPSLRPDAQVSPTPSPVAVSPLAPSSRVSAILGRRLARLGKRPLRGSLAGDPIRAGYSVSRFYRLRVFTAAWMTESGPSPRAAALLAAIRRSEADALDPAAFHLAALEALRDDIDRHARLGLPPDAEHEADFDILLSDAFLLLAGQLQSGAVKPKVPGYEWYLPAQDRKDLVEILERSTETGDVDSALKASADATPSADTAL
jgi:hypothetical protein